MIFFLPYKLKVHIIIMSVHLFPLLLMSDTEWFLKREKGRDRSLSLPVAAFFFFLVVA